mgnify:CR=1 FL=1
MNNPLTISGLHKTYSNGLAALKGIDLTVEAGDFFALLGPNGAGKSTTIGVICSLVNKTAGKVHIFGHDIDTDFTSARRLIGVVPQEFNFNQFDKVENIVMTQAGFYGIPRALARERCDKYLKQLGLWDKRKEVSRTLSGGMKRRLMIARALIHRPKLLILDEPTAGVDIEIRRSMWDFLKQLNAAGITIILTTHYLEEAESLCRNIAIINKGDIVENTSMKSLLSRLQTQTFVLDLKEPLDVLPVTDEFEIRQIDENTLEVELDKERSINRIFDVLNSQNIRVDSLRNKTNRLEELFINLVQESNTNQAAEEVTA